MQQTSKYKLNKPGTDDVISPVPLNENMDKLEGALSALEGQVAAVNGRVTTVDNRVTAVDGRRVFDHLLTATAPEGVKEFTVDLSGIDLTQYGALALVFEGEASSGPMKMYASPATQAFPIMYHGAGGTTYASHSGGGLAILFPSETCVYGIAISAGRLDYATGGLTSGIMNTTFPEITAFRFSPVGTSAIVSLYGLRF